MVEALARLFGLLAPKADCPADPPAARQPVRMVKGATVARELCQLACERPDVGEFIARNPHQRGLVQLKADGIRAIYVDGQIVTREGAPLDCALHCLPGLQRLEAALGGRWAFDGEYVAQEGFNATLAEHKRGEGQGTFWAFDMLPLEDWRAGRCETPQETRLARLRSAVAVHSDSLFVGMLDWWECTPAETIAKAREIWAAGGEGIVWKDPLAPYVRERSAAWQKIKQTFTIDAPILDVATRPDGTLRRLIVRGPLMGDGVAPLTARTIVLGTGWTKAEGRTIAAAHAGGLMEQAWARVSFQLTTGATRTIRGARFWSLTTGADS